MIVAMKHYPGRLCRLLFPGIPEIRPQMIKAQGAIFGWVTDSKAIIQVWKANADGTGYALRIVVGILFPQNETQDLRLHSAFKHAEICIQTREHSSLCCVRKRI